MEQENASRAWDWLLLILLGILCVIWTAEAEVLTENDAIQIALKNNRSLANAAMESQKAAAQTSAARTHFLPSLQLEVLGAQQVTDINFTFEQGTFGTYPGIGPVPFEDTVISTPTQPTATILGTIQQPLSQLYEISLNVKMLELNREIALEEERGARQQLVRDVRKAYYAIQQSESSLRSAQEMVALYKELDRVTEQYLIQQVVLKSDSMEVKTRMAKAESDVLTLTDQVVLAKQQLNSLLNRELTEEFEVDSRIGDLIVDADMGSAQAAALLNRPELKQSQLRVKQAELDRRTKKSEFIPEIGIQFQYTSLQNFDSFLPASYGSIGVQLKWEPFDWGRKQKELAEKALAIRQAENVERDTRNAVLTDVTDKLFKLQESQRLAAIARLSVEAATENTRVLTNKFHAEAALLKDVLQAQTELEESNSQYEQSLLGLRAAQAEFEKSKGEEQ